MRSPRCCNEPPVDNSVLENLEACCLSSLSRLSSNRHHASSTKSTRHTSPLEVLLPYRNEDPHYRRSPSLQNFLPSPFSLFPHHSCISQQITVCATEGANGRCSRVTIEAVWLFVACPLFPYLQICYDIDP
ncbi:hypothetical protein F2Q69_00036321 [Brassica cretica]|uniref:Uncharacterized protein n=1 Tax=Brassica cretica TaxID=69181 RepID=A0A8S9SJD5_BRACR|nr:hypothetical protein F2Q69_00036321 [Brassica cretica]